VSCPAENDTRRECKCKLTPALQHDGWPQEPGLCDLIDAPLFLVEKCEMHVTVAACAIDDRRLGSKTRRSTIPTLMSLLSAACFIGALASFLRYKGIHFDLLILSGVIPISSAPPRLK
jgi:hypothetical protein